MRKAGIIIAAVLVVLCGGLGWAGYQMFDLGREIVGAGVTQQQFDAQKLGTPEADVLAALPEPLTDMRDKDLYGADPGRGGVPAGARCDYFTIKQLAADGPELWRFCFVGGALAEKSSLTIPG